MSRPLTYLTLVVAVAAAIMFWSGKAFRPEAEIFWPTYDADATGTLAVSLPGGAFQLERSAGAWFVRLPGVEPALRADAQRVDALLSFLAHNRPLRRLERAEDSGLESPRATLTVNGGPVLALGAEVSGNEGVYASLGPLGGAEGQLLVLSVRFVEILSRPASYYYDLRPLAVEPRQVVRVALEGLGGESWEVDRSKGDEFTRPEPLAGAKAEGGKLDQYLHEALGVHIADMAPEASVEGLDTRLELSVWTAGNVTPRTLRVFVRSGGEGPWLAASSWQPSPFLLDRERLEDLSVSSFLLLDRRVVILDLDTVKRLVLTRGERRLAAHRNGEGWKSDSGGQGLVGIDMALWRLTELKYEFEPVPASPATAQRELELELLDDQGDLALRLIFYADPALPEGLMWVRPGDGPCYPVQDALLSDLAGRLPAPAEGSAAN